jgi:rod shape-determining protein MreD
MVNKREIAGKIAAHILAILSVMISIIDIKISGLSAIIPLFDLIFIFYFAIFRNIFAIWFLFLLGLYHDSLNGNMVGITSLCYILSVKIFNILNHKLIIRKNFTQIWQQFMAFMIVFLIFKWLLLSIFNSAFYSINLIIIQFILTSALYVLSHKYISYFIANFE